MRHGLALVCGISLLLLSSPPSPAAAAPQVLVLVPYEDPGSSDPVALAVTQALAGDVAVAGTAVTKVSALDHLQAVANAAKLCADNQASGILVPDGRIQETMKPGFMSVTVSAHADFQLDEIGCDGTIRWSTTTSGDNTVSGLAPNIGGSATTAFTAAVQRAAAAWATASIPPAAAAGSAPASAAASSAPIETYVLLPFDELGMNDQRSADMTHALLARLQAHKLDVKVGTTIDPLAAVSHAQQLCAANAAQAIIVPSVRMEQSGMTGNAAIPHANLHLTMLTCNGTILGAAVAQGKFGAPMTFFRDPDQAVVSATDDASERAIIALLATIPK